MKNAIQQNAKLIEMAKRFVLFIFNEALCKYGQDLKHEQQLTEIFADNFMDIYCSREHRSQSSKDYG